MGAIAEIIQAGYYLCFVTVTAAFLYLIYESSKQKER